MRRLIYSSGDKYYLVNSNHFLSGLIINPLMKKKITVTQIEKKIYKYIKQPHKKITSLQLLFILIVTPLISRFLMAIETSKIFVINNKTAMLVVLLLWVIEYIIRYLQCIYDAKIVSESSTKIFNAKIFLSKKYYIHCIALKILRVSCYLVIYSFILNGTVFKMLLGIGIYIFLYWIKSIQWNINVIELEDGSILTPFGS